MARTPWKMYLSAWNLAGRCSSEFCEMAKKLTLNFKLNPQLKLENFSNFFFSRCQVHIWKFFILDHVSI